MNTNYFDSKNREYKVGDIVFNPCFGDYWLVEKWTDKQKEDCGFEDDYGFSLYGDLDLYSMDISDPVGFEIIYSIGEEKYDEALKELKMISKKMNEEESQ